MRAREQHAIVRRNWGGAREGATTLLLFLVALAVYGATMCRTVYTGDEGELITAVATGGVAHPTGYPLYCLLGRLFLLLLPFGEPALRVNALSAFFGATAVALLHRLLLALLAPPEEDGSVSRAGRLCAVAGALLLASAPTLWQLSLSAEVYTLGATFLLLNLYLLAWWKRDPADTRPLKLLAFAYGLSLTHHLNGFLVLPAYLIAVFADRRRPLWREPRTVGALLGLFLLPLSLYLYLPLTALRAEAPVIWGNPSTWDAFFYHVSGAQYRGLMFARPDLLGSNVAAYAAALGAEYAPWVLWLVPFGAFALLRSGDPARRSACLVLIWLAAVTVWHAMIYFIVDIYVYYLPSFLALAVWAAAGGWHLLGTAARLRRADAADPLQGSRRAAGAALAAAAGAALLLAPPLSLAQNGPRVDKSGNTIEADFAANVLKSAPRDAVVLVQGNVVFSLWYRQFVLGERPDVVVVNAEMVMRGLLSGNRWYLNHLIKRYPDVVNTYPEGKATTEQIESGDFLMALLGRALARGRSALFVEDVRSAADRVLPAYPTLSENIDRNFDRVPWGVGERLYPKGQAAAPAAVASANEELWAGFRQRGVYDGGIFADPFQEHMAVRYAEANTAAGLWAERAGRWAQADAGYARALKLFRVPAAEEGRARCAARLSARASSPTHEEPVQIR